MITFPMLDSASASMWSALLKIHTVLPTGWTIVGGNMVQLHCYERGFQNHRTTKDIDAVIDVRADKHLLFKFTDTLHDLGFYSTGVSLEGHEHRFQRGNAQIDVLIPDGLGERLQHIKGVTGSTTLAMKGAQQALDRTEDIDVVINDVSGILRRPNMLGSLVAKAAAWDSKGSTTRHLEDFVTLARMIRPSDNIGLTTKQDRRYLRKVVQSAASDSAVINALEAIRALQRIDQSTGLGVFGQ